MSTGKRSAPDYDDPNCSVRPASVKSRGRSSDRIVLDVGGREFVTSITTLTSNSSYFESMFSRRWSGGSDGDGADEEEEPRYYFLDQNPDVFAVVLSYMRERMIEVDVLDSRVLLLLEFLGVESLLSAVKAKAHCVVNPTYDGTEEDAIQAFHDKYGTIKQAIVRGHLPRLLRQGSACDRYDRDCASLIYPPEEFPDDKFGVDAKDMGDGRRVFPLLGAINWLHHHGYDTIEKKTSLNDRFGKTVAFSRRKQRFKNGTYQFQDLLIDKNQHEDYREDTKRTFALIISSSQHTSMFYAPGKDYDGEEDDTKSQWCVRMSGNDIIPPNTISWLRENGYFQRELEMEQLFDDFAMNVMSRYYYPDLRHHADRTSLFQFHIYSRPL